MDRVSLTIITIGFLAMLTCTTLVAYQNVRLGQLQHDTALLVKDAIALISRTHPVPEGR